VTGGVSSRRFTNEATAAVNSPGTVDPSTRHRSRRFVEANGIRYAYLNELTGQAVEKLKSRKSMLGLLATVYRTSNNAGLGAPCVVAVYRRQAKNRAQFVRRVFARWMG
jgi:hypothetical protein